MAIQSRRATIRDIRYKMNRIILDVLFNRFVNCTTRLSWQECRIQGEARKRRMKGGLLTHFCAISDIHQNRAVESD